VPPGVTNGHQTDGGDALQCRTLAAVFDRAKRNRLAARLQRTIGLPDNPLILLLVSQVAKANYPDNADPPLILTPVIGRQEVARVTADFLERGVGTIGTLYRAIWGMSPRVYVAQLEANAGDEPKRRTEA
jgi:hypothetical protein